MSSNAVRLRIGNPEPDEIAACEPFLAKQLEIIRPKVIVALGKFAAQTLLKDTTPITRLRGKWQSYHGIKADADLASCLLTA